MSCWEPDAPSGWDVHCIPLRCLEPTGQRKCNRTSGGTDEADREEDPVGRRPGLGGHDRWESGSGASTKVSAFNASMDHVYDIPVPSLSRSSDPASGPKHLAESVGAYATADCHGTDLSGGKTLDMGPLGTLAGPNLSNGLPTAYSDGELARLIQYGVKRDGRGVRLMPVQDFNWLPQADLVALISHLRGIPAVDRQIMRDRGQAAAKILDRRRNEIIFDVARRTSTAKLDTAPAPSPTGLRSLPGPPVAWAVTAGLGRWPHPRRPPSLPSVEHHAASRPGFPAGPTRTSLTLLNTGRRKMA